MGVNTNSVWAEPLPENCPPNEAKEPDGDTYFRHASDCPTREEDFYSNRKLYPERKFRVSECVARALSVYDNDAVCVKMRNFPTLKDKFVIRITLPKESGVIQRTGNNASHYSWWKLAAFNPIPFCSLLE